MKKQICFLSGLEIPQNKYSVEHYVPRSKVPEKISSVPYNIHPSIKVFNSVKADRFPCQWEYQKYHLLYETLQKWNLSQTNRHMIERAISRGLPVRDPCKYCVCAYHTEFCINEKLRQRHR